MTIRSAWLSGVILAAAFTLPAEAALRAGAARVDITPDASRSCRRVSKASTIGSSSARSWWTTGARARALVTVDAGALSTDTWTQVSTQAAKELQIPANHLMLTANSYAQRALRRQSRARSAHRAGDLAGGR